MLFSSIFSYMKCRSTSICFVISWWTDIFIVAWLSNITSAVDCHQVSILSAAFSTTFLHIFLELKFYILPLHWFEPLQTISCFSKLLSSPTQRTIAWGGDSVGQWTYPISIILHFDVSDWRFSKDKSLPWFIFRYLNARHTASMWSSVGLFLIDWWHWLQIQYPILYVTDILVYQLIFGIVLYQLVECLFLSQA